MKDVISANKKRGHDRGAMREEERSRISACPATSPGGSVNIGGRHNPKIIVPSY